MDPPSKNYRLFRNHCSCRRFETCAKSKQHMSFLHLDATSWKWTNNHQNLSFPTIAPIITPSPPQKKQKNMHFNTIITFTPLKNNNMSLEKWPFLKMDMSSSNGLAISTACPGNSSPSPEKKLIPSRPGMKFPQLLHRPRGDLLLQAFPTVYCWMLNHP